LKNLLPTHKTKILSMVFHRTVMLWVYTERKNNFEFIQTKKKIKKNLLCINHIFVHAHFWVKTKRIMCSFVFFKIQINVAKNQSSFLFRCRKISINNDNGNNNDSGGYSIGGKCNVSPLRRKVTCFNKYLKKLNVSKKIQFTLIYSVQLCRDW
jgi:hypothetical protein